MNRGDVFRDPRYYRSRKGERGLDAPFLRLRSSYSMSSEAGPTETKFSASLDHS